MGTGSIRMWRQRMKWRHGGPGRARAGAPAFESPMGALLQSSSSARRAQVADPAPWETGRRDADRTTQLHQGEAFRRSVAEAERAQS